SAEIVWESKYISFVNAMHFCQKSNFSKLCMILIFISNLVSRFLVLTIFHLLNKLIKEIVGVLRSGTGFGMILYRETGVCFVLQAFIGSVVQGDMGFDEIGIFQRFLIYSITVILRSNGYFIFFKIQNGMIATAMAEFQFEGFCATRS